MITGGNDQIRLKRATDLIRKIEDKDFNDQFQNPDIFLLQETDSIKISQVRQLKKQLQLKPFQLKHKFALIINAEKLTIAAQNALLKTLEEPPASSIIILTNRNQDLLLKTINSRCEIIKLPVESGSVYGAGEIEKQFEVTKMILEMRPGRRLLYAEKIAKSKETAIGFVDIQLHVWRQIIRQRILTDKQMLPFANLKFHEIIKIINLLQRARQYLNNHVNPKLLIENLLIAYPTIENA